MQSILNTDNQDAGSGDYLLAAAANGLFPAQMTRKLGAVSIDFERRDYSVRPALISDLSALHHLEEQCWPQTLRAAAAVLQNRVAKYPQGQLVLVIDAGVVGVIYSQCIADVQALYNETSDSVEQLHCDEGAVVQLLAVNVLPSMQQRNLGDQLLEFMLQYCSVQASVSSVVAVTLCKNYDRQSGLAMADYLRSRNAQGTLVDPVLRFHELHGAKIEGLIANYRPLDIRNEGYGVLVSYDLEHRFRRELAIETTATESIRSIALNHDSLKSTLQTAIIECLGEHKQEAFAFDRPLMEMGLDSADLLALGEKLAHQYQQTFKPGFFFQYQTPGKILAYLGERLAVSGQQTVPQNSSEVLQKQTLASVTQSGRQDRSGPIAIIGMACRLPGDVNSPEALWDALKAGLDLIGELPPGRWQWPAGIDPQQQHQGIDCGGFLDRIDIFDAPFFRISPKEAEAMDPQQRLLLELAWQTIEHACYAPARLANSNTGVFIGASGSDYSRLWGQANLPVDAHCSTGASMAVLANRISYFFDLHGPSLLIDTACSSSLVAVHQAVESLQSGESSQALVGGINILCHPANSIAYYKAGMLAKDGRCKAFDQQADGYVRSEGVVMLLLKPLAAALADGDQIHALIKGSACNHGGQASGLTVPNPAQQAALLQKAWQAANTAPQSLSYIEAHGTGTALGDPIEIQGLQAAFAKSPLKDHRCGIGSVKTNLGHLEAAAGITGLLKVVLCLQHRELAASLHFRQLNKHIDLSDSPFYIVDQHQPWQPSENGQPRRAGVSSFGSGGANAHVVLEEFVSSRAYPACPAQGPVVFVLSARNKQQLQIYAENYIDWLSANAESMVMADLVYTLQIGRQALDERLALVVNDRQDLLEKLNHFCARQLPVEQGYQFNIKAVTPDLQTLIADTEAINTAVKQHDLNKIAMLWASGAVIEWSALYDNLPACPRRITLPTYPFAEHAYWLPEPELGESSGIIAIEQITAMATSVDNESETPAALLTPVWRTLSETVIEASLYPKVDARLLIVGGTQQQCDAILAIYADARCLAIALLETVDTMFAQLKQLPTFDHIVWIVPDNNADSWKDGSVIDTQQHGLLAIFRLLKALLALRYDSLALGLTLISTDTQAVFGHDVPKAVHAGIHGLAGALAKEYPQWRVRALDMEDGQVWSIHQMFALPVDEQGETWAYRSQQWFQRVLIPVKSLPDHQSAYRQQGVYVVIGGAGGIGEAWSRTMIESYQAQLIWIGRRNKDQAIQDKLDALAKLGPAPWYITADASDFDALRQAYTDIKQHYPQIHGVIHAAVGLFDDSLAAMSETHFRKVLSARIDVSVRLAQVFQKEPLDFLLFFSSIVAFEKNGGLSGYAAGCAFEDAFARQLSRQLPFAVKVMNWGHWRVGTGDTISQATKIRLQNSGIVPIEADEAMDALQTLLTSPLPHCVLVKTRQPELLPVMQFNESLHIYADKFPSCLPALYQIPDDSQSEPAVLQAASIFQNPVLTMQLLPLLAGILQTQGWLGDTQDQPSILNCYTDWLATCKSLLNEQGFKPSQVADMDVLWAAWDNAKAVWHKDVNIKAALDLAEACLRSLPDILTGRQKATEIMFPDSSMRRVEGIYRGNRVADYFNDALADRVVAAINARLQENPEAQLRILEIGAGTGGTTARLLPKLSAYQQNIREYCYSDISKAFLFHAQEQFAPHYPFVQTKLFDVEKPLAGQGIAVGQYDLVIATNVLHATRNIRQTLANAKAALQKNGLLLLNEISDKSLFAHLTFGLLPGWWLAEDQTLRIPGSPCLYPESWQQVLQQEGFGAVLLPNRQARVLGQQLIIAESDGIVRQYQTQANTAVSPAQAPAQDKVTAGVLKQKGSQTIKKLVARTLRMKSDDLDVSEPLESYGIDSILVVQITNSLRESFGDISRTLLFECQTIAALTDYFICHHQATLMKLTGLETSPIMEEKNQSGGTFTSPPPKADYPPNPSVSLVGQASGSSFNEPIAVVGMSCRFAQADNIDAYWQLLKNGRDCVQEIPQERWLLDGFFHADPDEAVAQGKSYSKWGSFIADAKAFDPQFFNISPKEAVTIDPQERLFLQATWEALEDAGYTRTHLAQAFRQKVGVFAGITRTGFDLFGPSLWQQGTVIYPHTSFSSVANRVSYFLNLRGPSVPVDTMCSSSLTAIHQACQNLRYQECELAIAGGVNLYLHPSGYVGLSASRMLSKEGRCKSFGARGNGFVPGEGVGVVVLKPLARAIADQDNIHAVIRSSHVNHGGKTNGYTVPNPQAQTELIREALDKEGIDARTVSYIEAHGTGTELGDPIEITGLTQAFQQDTRDTGFCALGSVKTNLGHLEAAAGIAGFIKVILQMRHGQLVKSLHAEETNPAIEFGKTPFAIQQNYAPWQRPVLERNGTMQEYPRIAGVSSFGAGGVNAHVILEEYPQQQEAVSAGRECLIVLSAKNAERLKAYAEKLHGFIKNRTEFGQPALNLPDLAYTLQTGREAMEERLALLVRSVDELAEKLPAFIEGRDDIDDIFRGQANRHKEVLAIFAGDEQMDKTIQVWMQQRNYAKLLNLWSKGLNIDWEQLYCTNDQPVPRRISLPTYPFAAKTYWLPEVAEKSTTATAVASPKNLLQEPELSVQAEQLLPQADVIKADTKADSAPIPGKPSGISLQDLSGFSGRFVAQGHIAKRTLTPLHRFDDGIEEPSIRSSADSTIIATHFDPVRLDLYDNGQGVFTLQWHNPGKHSLALSSISSALRQGFVELTESAAASEEPPKVLLFKGLEQLCLSPDENRAEIFSELSQMIADVKLPVIAMLKEYSQGPGWLMAALCEVIVVSEEGLYCYQDKNTTREEYQFFEKRFGVRQASTLFSSAKTYTGKDLAALGLTLPVLPESGIDSYTLDTAYAIARAPRIALIELKSQLTQALQLLTENLIDTVDAGQVHGLRQSALETIAVADPGVAVKVELNSSVVSVEAYQNGVVLVSLSDQASKNTFSPEFVNGVIAAFEHIRNTVSYKVVVLTGYAQYFACGGTKEGLLAIQSGSARFTDEQSYSLPLLCEIPVIAAMQGHAIGAGWAMGLFCDVAVYSEESYYQSPYMLYGFTPGAGSTLIFPQRLGYDLSREILFTAKSYKGSELKQRGLDAHILPRAQVLSYALGLANRLALSPRATLSKEKDQRSRLLREQLPITFAQELLMHDKTFVGSQAVIANIQQHFNDVMTVVEADLSLAQLLSENSGQQNTFADIVETLRESLIEELSMQQETVHDDLPFIDMGMDSISAVTWVRKINKHYGLNLGATKVYSYPTLKAFALHILAEQNQIPHRAAQMPESAGSAAELWTMLCDSLATELSMTPDAIDEETAFIDMGMDSISAVTWVRKINHHYGLAIGATKIYSHPNLREFHRYLLQEGKQHGLFCGEAELSMEYTQATISKELTTPVCHQSNLICSYDLTLTSTVDNKRATIKASPERGGSHGLKPQQSNTEAQQKPENNAPQTGESAIAIIGMSGRFPKADNLQQFWDNLVQGRDCVSEIPASRWHIDDYYSPDRQAPGKTICRYMGALDDVDVFEPLFFNISPQEAEFMDPQQRLFLQASWHCIEDAGYSPAKLSGMQCGVFAGCGTGDYSQSHGGQILNAQGLMGESASMLPARISYLLNLQGPSLAIDTACSSSLVAIATACDNLLLGNCDLALAGGVYVITGPEIHVKMSQSGMLSPDGRCFSFDQRANGFVPGEGVGVLLLKRLQQAEQDGDDIYGVIRGWGVNQDGKTNGITAPNPHAQTRLEKSVYQRFGINPEHIQMVEAHGTGTKLGDPIEVEGLRETFNSFTDKRNFCALGSVKSNIGHLATAAGVSGVIKAMLALQHRTLPPTINYQNLNEHIELQDSAFYINTQCRDWQVPEGQKRLSAVSSFGFSGTNAHLVLEDYPGQKEETLPLNNSKPLLFVLSAKTAEQLHRCAGQLSDYLEKNPYISLADVAYTLQTGREAMAFRLAVIADNSDGLRAKLCNYQNSPDCFTGIVDCFSPDTQTQALSADKVLTELAKQWIQGEAINWLALYQPGQARRLHGLPGYPFAREHYWLPNMDNAARTQDEDERTPVVETAQEDSELWFAEEISGNIDWNQRLRHYQDAAITVLYADNDDKEVLNDLIRKMAQAANLAGALTLDFIKSSEISCRQFPKAPDALLWFGSKETPQADLPVMERLLAVLQTKNCPALSIVYLFRQTQTSSESGVNIGDSLKTAVNSHAQYNWTLITQTESTDTLSSVRTVLTEWLATDISKSDTAALTEIRFQAGQRFVRRTSPVFFIIKDWQEKNLDTSIKAASYGSIVILVNQDSVRIARQLMPVTDFEHSLVIGNLPDAVDLLYQVLDYSDVESGRACADTVLAQLQSVSLLVDLSDLYDSAKAQDDDKPGKMIFYQMLMGSYADISILYFTKSLQTFRCSQMSLAGAKFAGLVKMLSADYEHAKARFIDIDQPVYRDYKQLRQIIDRELAAELQETEICYRQGQRFVPYLHCNSQPQHQQPCTIDNEGVYVISGGTSGVGLEIAKYLAAKGCQKLVLMGINALPSKMDWATLVQQSGLSSSEKDKLNALIQLDKTIKSLRIYTGPLTDQQQLADYFGHIREQLGPIKGIVHSAAVYSDASRPDFVSKDPVHMQQVLAVKINGLESLHAVFENDAPDFFVTFSSLAAVLPRLARGAADYVQANTFVDFFNTYQSHQKNNTRYKTISWADWHETGALTRLPTEKFEIIANTFEQIGLRTFSNQEGCRLFENALAFDNSRVFPAYVNTRRFREVAPQLLFAQLPQHPVEIRDPATIVPSLLENLLAHLAQWEAEKQSGSEITVDKIIAVISFDDIQALPAELIHRIYQLLFSNTLTVLPQSPQDSQDKEAELRQLIIKTVSDVLKLTDIDVRKPFQNYGLDSISAMVLATRLEKQLQQLVEARWLVDFSTVETLSRHLISQNPESVSNT